MTGLPTLTEATKVWFKIGCLSFGGPAGQIALMHREVVDDRNWVSDRRFLHALNFCTLLPGPEAMQLATYLGWLMHGPGGAQMLESMIENPRPTRAEASDVANAVYDGTDAVMLSGETAAGKYPVQTVAMMAKIVAETEHQIRLDPPPRRNTKLSTRLSVAETICECMAHSAVDLELSAIAIFTETGSTARLLSKYHPEPPIFALSPYQKVVNRAMLLWGTFPILCSRFRDTDKLVSMAEEILESQGYVHRSQIVGIVAGTRTKSGATNFMRLHMVGDRDEGTTAKKSSIVKKTPAKKATAKKK